MSLAPTARVGVYEVIAAIGEGGMGQVYRARDTKLNRDVALKVLPEAFAADADRLARFTREAQTLAALNHPNIAHIHGLEESGGVRALVMELVEGEDLAQRIARGAVPLSEALPIAAQIALALEAAHEQGIVHRDLKPANIKVRADGTVKVLDFGLAKAMEPAGVVATSVPMSPTITSPAMTQAGIILGTAAYMAPEQASGKPVDKRADIWAFGVVLWEMLTGRQMFEGETISHVLAAILTREPDFAMVPADVHPLLARCLEKDPRKRLRDIGDAMSLVQAPQKASSGMEAGPRSRRWAGVLGWAAAGALAVLAGAAAWWRPASNLGNERPPVRFQIERAADIYNQTTTAFALSPDGLMLVYYGAGDSGGQTLFVRTLGTGDVRQMPAASTFSAQANSLFWSADSRQLVRSMSSGAQVLDVATGGTRLLCDCRFSGGSWDRDGTILLGGAPNFRGGVRRLSAGDRAPVAITKTDPSRGEEDRWPVFLPGGRRFLFTRSAPGTADTIQLGTLDGDPPKRLVEGSRSIVVAASGGRGSELLWIGTAGLMAQAFDPDTMTLSGTSVTVVAGAASVSAVDNLLVTSAAGARPRTIPTWFDRKGTVLGNVGEASLIEGLALSHDGRTLAVSEASTGQSADIWLLDIAGGGRTRATFSPDNESTPVWSADATRVFFSARHNGMSLPYEKAADGTGGETPLFVWDRQAYVNDASSDGHWVLFSSLKPDSMTDNDLWVLSMERGSDRKPAPYLVAPGKQQQAQFSPDGRFVAYGSDQSGTWEIFVQPFPNAADGKWMVSNGGGAEPRWSRDGKELFYFSGQTLMAVPISLRPTFSNGAPAALFDAPVQIGYTNDSHRWQLAPDGRRFLLLTDAGKDQAPPLDLIVNWLALLKK